MNLKKLLLCISVAGMVASCTSDIDLYDVGVANEQEELEITLDVVPFVKKSCADTRAQIFAVSDYEDFKFTFDVNDEIGIYFLDTKENAPFTLSVNKAFSVTNREGKLKNTFVLTNEQKESLKGHSFILYYPYNEWFSEDCVSMYFGDQKQSGLENPKNEGGFYFISETYKEIPSKKIQLYPLNSVFRIIVNNLPKGTYSKVELVNCNNEKTFKMAGYCEWNNSKLVNPEFYYSTSSLPLNLKDISWNTDSEDSECIFYIAAYPSKTGEFKVKVTDVDGNVFYSKETFPNDDSSFSDEDDDIIESGVSYDLNCTLDISDNMYDTNGHEAVDLGLSVKWATMNVGAENVMDCGKLYAWGETEGFVYNSKTATPADLKEYCMFNNNEYTKYTAKDGLKTLSQEDDVASKEWKGGWRMPTKKEMQELVDGCFMVLTSNYNKTGVGGCIVYRAENTADRGKFANVQNSNSLQELANAYAQNDVPHIFLPFTPSIVFNGSGSVSEIHCDDFCAYWTSSLYNAPGDEYANSFFATEKTLPMHYGYHKEERCVRLCVRAVIK